MTTSIRTSPSGRAVADIAEVLLAPTLDDYFVDPVNGNDNGSGSAIEPLQTLTELSRRLAGVLVSPSASLTATILSDTPADDRLLATVNLSIGSTFTLQGVATDVAEVTISAAVARPASGATYVWTITTSGIDWTATTARRILLPTGEVGYVGLVIDANNVACGRFTNESTTNSTTPVAGPATVQTCTQISAPVLRAVTATTATSNTAFSQNRPQLVVRDLEATASNLADMEFSGPIRIYGCRFTPRNIYGGLDLIMQSCLLRLEPGALAGAPMAVMGFGAFLVGCVFDTDQAAAPASPFASFRSQLTTLRECAFFRCGLSAEAVLINVNGGTYYEGFNQPAITLSRNAMMAMLGAAGTIAEGSVAAASSALSVINGAVIYYDTGLPPNVTGGTADILLGTGTIAYAALPAAAVSGSGAAILVSD